MDEKRKIEIQINAIENEMASIYSAQVLHEMKVIDAEQPTGNAQVDAEMMQIADRSKQTLAYQNRMISVRESKLAELRAKLEAVKQA